MRALLFGLIPFCLFMMWGRWYYVCKIHQLCGPTTDVELVTGDGAATLNLNSGEETILSDHEQFQFSLGDNTPRLSKDNKLFLDKTADYLKAREEKGLTITGNYLAKEKDIKYGFFENLGQARAATIREMLMQRGIDESRFTIDYNMIDKERLNNPLAFDIFDNSADAIPSTYGEDTGGARRLTRTKFTFHDMTFSDANFESDSDVFKPGRQCKLYADSVKIYLDENRGKSLTIIGHTDSQASDDYNQDLGQRRADNAKKYFKKLGVKADINVVSMGEKQPVATNGTPQGRQKNRRVNFKIE